MPISPFLTLDELRRERHRALRGTLLESAKGITGIPEAFEQLKRKTEQEKLEDEARRRTSYETKLARLAALYGPERAVEMASAGAIQEEPETTPEITVGPRLQATLSGKKPEEAPKPDVKTLTPEVKAAVAQAAAADLSAKVEETAADDLGSKAGILEKAGKPEDFGALDLGVLTIPERPEIGPRGVEPPKPEEALQPGALPPRPSEIGLVPRKSEMKFPEEAPPFKPQEIGRRGVEAPKFEEIDLKGLAPVGIPMPPSPTEVAAKQVEAKKKLPDQVKDFATQEAAFLEKAKALVGSDYTEEELRGLFKDQYYKQLDDEAKRDLDKEFRRAQVAKLRADEEKAKIGKDQTKAWAAIAKDAMAATYQAKIDSFDRDATPEQLTAANQELDKIGLSYLQQNGIDITNPAYQASVKASLSMAKDDLRKTYKKQQADDKMLQEYTDLLDLTRRLGENVKKRRDSKFTPETQDMIARQLDALKLPWGLDSIGEAIRKTQLRTRLTPPQLAYFLDTMDLKNNIMKLKNANFNITDSDAARLEEISLDFGLPDSVYYSRVKEDKRNFLLKGRRSWDARKSFFELDDKTGKDLFAENLGEATLPEEGPTIQQMAGKESGEQMTGGELVGAELGRTAQGAIGGIGELGKAIIQWKDLKKIDWLNAARLAYAPFIPEQALDSFTNWLYDNKDELEKAAPKGAALGAKKESGIEGLTESIPNVLPFDQNIIASSLLGLDPKQIPAARKVVEEAYNDFPGATTSQADKGRLLEHIKGRLDAYIRTQNLKTGAGLEMKTPQ